MRRGITSILASLGTPLSWDISPISTPAHQMTSVFLEWVFDVEKLFDQGRPRPIQKILSKADPWKLPDWFGQMFHVTDWDGDTNHNGIGVRCVCVRLRAC